MKKAILLSAIITSFTHTVLAFNTTATLNTAVGDRTYTLHSPGTQVSPNMPVMLVLHGDGGTGAGIQSYSGFDAIADANNFIAVYPDAIASSWNRYVDNVAGDAGLNNPNAPDDVQFMTDLIESLCTNYQIDKSKVYVTGHSAGGFMAYNLALLLPNKIAAFAPVAGSLWGDEAAIQGAFGAGYIPVPIYHIHGDADNTVTYPDANNMADSWGEWPLNGFGYANCNSDTYTSTTTVVSGVERKEFCANGAYKVTLIRILGGGHGWPNVAGFNTAQNIWNFCKEYSLSNTASCGSTAGIGSFNQNKNLLYPNPAKDNVSIQSDFLIQNITIKDITGKIISTQKVTPSHQINLSTTHLSQGIYVVEWNNETYTQLQKLIIN